MYPPKIHVLNDLQKIFRVMEAFKFATLISRTEDDVIVTHVPLILERGRGEQGYLIGHMDRDNPHARYLDEGGVTAIFHGPNAYISPNVYAASRLPTWNSLSVHAKGYSRILASDNDVRDILVKMACVLESSGHPYVLEPDNKEMLGKLKYIVGFEIEITELIGRFKLSQDESFSDKERAKDHLITQDKKSNEAIIEYILNG